MAATVKSAGQAASHSGQILFLQGFTIAWLCVECGVSLLAARQSNSTALFAFGSDSFVELLSACLVVLQFIPSFPLGEKQAARWASVLLFALCLAVAASSINALVLGTVAETSVMGMVITSLAVFIMPVVAKFKRNKARQIHNRALAADAVQSATCAYLAAMTLVSLTVNTVFHVTWIDAVAALLAVPILIYEGQRAWKGKICGCC